MHRTLFAVALLEFTKERLPTELPSGGSVPYLRFPFLLPTTHDKDALMSNPLARSLGISPMYPSSIEEIPELQDIISRGSCPSSSSIADRLITLPTHRYVSDEDKHRICDLLLDRLDRQASSRTLDTEPNWRLP